MIAVTLIAVGKIKETFFSAAINEYLKRLKRYANVNIIEVKDEATVQNPSEREKEIILDKEGERIAAKIPSSSYVITLCVEGRMLDSVELSDFILKEESLGVSHITVIIGGSFGLSDSIKSLSKLKLSFSKMTFPHQLMRVIFLEQLYRSFTISEGKTYHK